MLEQLLMESCTILLERLSIAYINDTKENFKIVTVLQNFSVFLDQCNRPM